MTTTGGKHWQEWLSGPDAAYLEIQAGLARTQLEHLPMPGGATWSWVEAYGMLRADPRAVHGPWEEARAAAADALDALVPASALEAALEAAQKFSDPESTLCRGSGWGALEVAAGTLTPRTDTPFGACQARQAPWLELLETGRLPICDPPAEPVLGPHWRELLEAGASDHHALYHLGLMRLADGEADAARDAFRRSVREQRTPWALRALACLPSSQQEPADLLAEAHRLRPDLRELTIEALDALIAAHRRAEALDIIEALSAADRGHGRIRLAEARAAHLSGDDDRVRRLLAEGIQVDDLREGELTLSTLWHAVHPGEPVPPAYDFRMSND